VADVEQPWVRPDLGDRDRARPCADGSEAQSAGDPRLAADGLTQVDWRLIGQLDHHGQFALLTLAHCGEQRVLVAEQDADAAARVHVVQHSRHATGNAPGGPTVGISVAGPSLGEIVFARSFGSDVVGDSVPPHFQIR
jgi:hypothetical protein